ncbi:hypothetical protein ACRAWD_04750 [Caulobacter segnis]
MTQDSKVIQGRTGPGKWSSVSRCTPRSPASPSSSRRRRRLRRGAERAGQPRGRRHAGHAAGAEPVLRRAGRTRRAWACKAQINIKSRFDRKNYFYPDLPQGYQISQFDQPIVGEGVVSVERDDGTTFDVRIERLHLEQDAGKSLHDQDPNATYVDLNRRVRR